jgi:hypothetical protein
MYCVPRLVFGGTKGVGSRFHVLRARTHFQRYRGRPVPFSCFARSDSFSAERRASCPVFMFCALGLIFGDTEVVGSRFQVLRPESFSAIPRASGPVFMFCTHGIVFGSTEGVVSRFHVMRVRTRFQWYRGRRVSLSCFAHPNSFSAVPRPSSSVFMFCAP